MLILILALGSIGLASGAAGVAMRRREREAELASMLDLPLADRSPAEVDRYLQAAVESSVRFVQAGLGRSSFGERLRTGLERAHVPLRPAEYVLIVGGMGLGVAGLIATLTGSVVTGAVLLAIVPAVAHAWLGHRITARREAAEAQLPDFLTLVGTSLQGGHSFLRAVQLYAEEAEPPLREELERVLAETRLGDPLVDALERMAQRIELADLTWVVQAIRIQQKVGGGLAELFLTLADFMRAREEVRMETRALTADARMSAWILGLLPLVVLIVLQVASPGYLEPMLSGSGLLALFLAGLMAASGAALIMRMSKVEV